MANAQSVSMVNYYDSVRDEKVVGEICPAATTPNNVMFRKIADATAYRLILTDNFVLGALLPQLDEKPLDSAGLEMFRNYVSQCGIVRKSLGAMSPSGQMDIRIKHAYHKVTAVRLSRCISYASGMPGSNRPSVNYTVLLLDLGAALPGHQLQFYIAGGAFGDVLSLLKKTQLAAKLDVRYESVHYR
ncbi:MAG: hypothetical protein KGI00_02655 [Candidatus Micrarchaeota archaeon]|nr:hypothetical protein [Candidatus Micrarchaeota archaeon]MDE1824460.1 hypothetical protein [Candidatus Micrarchaeota archaeon]MDE1849607.1 hypothetical protein [Candidatus Micrarchaeota archaeon]